MGSMVKRLAVLGSTGSIGRQTLEVVRAFPDRFRVIGLAGGRNTELLARQIQEFHPQLVSAQLVDPLRDLLPAMDGEFSSLEGLASHPEVDLVVVATSGRAGLLPTITAIRAGKDIALANKEVLVMAGSLISSEANQKGVKILPLDSEHSAVWQCLRDEPEGAVAQIILTASGGPLYRLSRRELATVTPEVALRHPTWQMGKKVTIDSATLMNKGMEVIEAHFFFQIPLENIAVIIHPQSIVHSLVEFVDGSVKAQLSPPDMRFPIQHALCYPERLPNPQLPRLDWANIGSLTFELPDGDRFPCLKLAFEAGRRGGTYPTVLCAADEVAVDLFLQHRIGFLDIARVVEETLDRHHNMEQPSLEELQVADSWAREAALEIASPLEGIKKW
jgi:1-deoxy-D-xylulose-5-phosphate reductoisomerase